MVLSKGDEAPSCLPGGEDPPHVMQGLLSQIVGLHLQCHVEILGQRNGLTGDQADRKSNVCCTIYMTIHFRMQLMIGGGSIR